LPDLRNGNSRFYQTPDQLKQLPLLLLPVYLVVFSAFFDTHAQMPVLAPYAAALGATPFLIGSVIGTYSLFNIAGNFAGGLAIDRKGWKMPLLGGLIGVSLILFLYTRAGSAYDLILIRGAHGFMGGILVPAALACLTIGEGGSGLRGRRLAGFGAAIGLAALTGPLVAGIIASRISYQAVYLVLAAMMLTATIAAFPLLKSHKPCRNLPGSPRISFRQISGHPALLGAFLFALGTMGATGTLASFLPSRAEEIGFNPAQTGMLFATFAITAVIIQIAWPLKLKPLLRENCRACVIGLLLLSLALVLAAFLHSRAGMFFALAIYGLGFGLSFQGMLGLVIEGSQPAWRGRAIGLFFAVYSLGVAIVPPLSGLIWQNLPAIFPFYTAAAIALLSTWAGRALSAETS